MSLFINNIPFNELPDLPTVDDSNILNSRIFMEAIKASRALTELNCTIRFSREASIYADLLCLQEAKSSFELHNLNSSSIDLHKSIVSEVVSNDSKTLGIISYHDILTDKIKLNEDGAQINFAFCKKIHELLTNRKASIRKIRLYNVIGRKENTVYSSPYGKAIISERVSNWEFFVNSATNWDVLIKLALMYYQFQVISPFPNYNGRISRILFLCYLRFEGLLKIPALPICRYLIANQTNYNKAFKNVIELNELGEWIFFVLQMIKDTSIQAIEKLNSISKQMIFLKNDIQSCLPKVYSEDFFNVLIQKPFMKRSDLIEAKLGSLATVGKYLRELQTNGFLYVEKVGREKLYLNHRLLAAIDG